MKSYLLLFSLLMVPSSLFANQAVSTSFLCRNFDSATYQCMDNSISAGTDIIAEEGMKLSFFTAISSSTKSEIRHVWVNAGVDNSIQVKYRDIAPMVSVNKKDLTGNQKLEYNVHYSKNSPIAWVLSYAGTVPGVKETVVMVCKDIAYAVVTNIIAKQFTDQLSKLFKDEEPGIKETKTPIVNHEFLNQIKIYISSLYVDISDNYRTFSNKIIDPLAHKGAWIIYVIDDQGEVLNSFKFNIS